jgi:hypothetical protein
MKHSEYTLQKQVCTYLKLQYPNVLFLSDSVAFCKLSIPQSVRNKFIQNQNFSCPDLIILKPNGLYHSLFLELKIKSPYKKNGGLYSNEHLEAQANTIKDLNELGFMASFCWTFEDAKNIIDTYLKIK